MQSFLLTSMALFILWLALVLFSKNTRKEQLIMSIVGLIITPAILLMVAIDHSLAAKDPLIVIGIEDLIFSFSLFGIASVIYHALLGKHFVKLKGKRYKVEHPLINWVTHLIALLGLWASIALLLTNVFGLHAVRALVAGGLIIGVYIIIERHDLLINALLSGLMMAVLIFILEQLFAIRLSPSIAEGFWQFDNIKSIMISGVPVEKILWASVVGFAIGPMYEYIRHYKLK
jgi:hypothetical protein